jgi:hypothetical protein
VTCIISSSKLTDFASAVVGTNALADFASLLTKVLIPSLQKKLLVLFYQFGDLVQLSTRKSIVGGQLGGIKPELRFIFRSLYVYVSRFFAFVAEKVEANLPIRSTVGIGEFTAFGENETELLSPQRRP